jgi:hypothetical protein
MDFTHHAGNDCGGRSLLNVDQHHFTDNLARQRRAISFDVTRGHRPIAITSFGLEKLVSVFRALRLV